MQPGESKAQRTAEAALPTAGLFWRTIRTVVNKSCGGNRRETGDVVELLEKLCSHRMLEEVGSGSGIDSPPGKPLQHLHSQGITEPSIQFSSIIRQRPLGCSFVVVSSR